MIQKIINIIKDRWNNPGGYKQVLQVAIPLILSTGSWSITLFVDRMFLSWLDPSAIAAAMPAGILNFMTISFFMGLAGFVSTFVAQYYGASTYDKIGIIIWQGVLISLIGGVLHILFIPLSGSIFSFIGHSNLVQTQEIIYYKMLCWGAFFPIVTTSISGFFTGRGKSWPVMWINVFTAIINIILDYALIFGNLGFPKMGIKGAAIATVISGGVSLLIYLVVIFSPINNRTYSITKGMFFDKELFMRLIKYGAPSGAQFFIDITGFTFFIMFVGKIGDIELIATNIAFNINTLAFMPMIGMGIAVSVLVGQNLGNNNPTLATRSVYSGFHLVILYMVSIAITYFLFPDFFLKPFAHKYNTEDFIRIRAISINLLKFIAIYSIFDSFTIIFSSAIKGAGDTKFVMILIITSTICFLIIPCYVAYFVLGLGIYSGWFIITFYIALLGNIFLIRFRNGKWKSMRVIEERYTNV